MPPRHSSGGSAAAVAAASAGDDASDRVFVAVRARPLVPTERAQRAKEAVFVAADGHSILVGRERQFKFDAAFGTDSHQEGVYATVVAPLVAGCFAGACLRCSWRQLRARCLLMWGARTAARFFCKPFRFGQR
jgi:hypothetical protein